MASNMDEVSGLLHVIEKTGDHGGQFNNIRTQALQRLKVIEDEAAEAVANAKKEEIKKAQAEQNRLATARSHKVDEVAKTEEERLKKEEEDKKKAVARATAEATTPMKSPEEVEKERLEKERLGHNPVLHPDPQPMVPLDQPAPKPILERKL